MKNQPRDSKGRFLRLKTTPDEWRKMLTDSNREWEIQKRTAEYYKAEVTKLRTRLETWTNSSLFYQKALKKEQRGGAIANIIWTVAIVVVVSVAIIIIKSR